MEISADALRRNFQSKTDTELVELASSGQELTPDARSVLLEELQNRLAKARQTGEAVPLRHGWYTVVASTSETKFPDFCPRCSRHADVSSLQFASREHRRFRYFSRGTKTATSNVPHCSECSAELKRSRAVLSWISGSVGIAWIVAIVWLRIPRFVYYVGSFIIFAPFVYFYDRTSAVKLGDHDGKLVEYRFKSHEYAKTFAQLNNVATEHVGTLQGELECAISHIRQ